MSAVLQEVGSDYVRQHFLGSSDIAGVLGISPWNTPVTVWQKKTSTFEPRDESAPKKKLFNRGKIWESVVSEMLVAELESQGHKVTVLNANKRYIDPTMQFCAAEIDFEIKLDDIEDVVNVELKTVSPFAAHHWGESMSDEVPLWYAAQGMFGLMVTGRKCCVLAPLFGADEVKVYPIIRDEETIAGMRHQADIFWNQFVIPKLQPDPKTLDDVDRLFKKDSETILTAEPWMVDKLMRYKACSAELDARGAELALLQYEIKREMKEASILRLPGQDKNAVTWKTQKSSHIDVTAFKAAYPKMAKEFTKEGTTRVFKVNQFQLGASVNE
jgi:putative phage-type endonuclease